MSDSFGPTYCIVKLYRGCLIKPADFQDAKLVKFAIFTKTGTYELAESIMCHSKYTARHQ